MAVNHLICHAKLVGVSGYRSKKKRMIVAALLMMIIALFRKASKKALMIR